MLFPVILCIRRCSAAAYCACLTVQPVGRPVVAVGAQDNWIEDVVDSLYGIIRDKRFIPTDYGDPRLKWAWAEPADNEHVFGKKTLNRGSAVSYCSERALLKACGEAIERYCSGCYSLEALTFGGYSPLKEIAVDPALFPVSSPNGTYPEKNSDVLSERYWCSAVSWEGKEIRLVPAECVYVPFLPDGYRPLLDGISTGLACHSSFQRATLGAVLEVIERDAFMLFWYLGEIRAHVAIDSIGDAGANKIIKSLKRAGYELYISDISDNLICPVVLCIAFHRSAGFPKATIGLGADRNPNLAVLKALEELSLGVLGMRKLLAKRPIGYPQSFNTLDDHGFWYAADPKLSGNLRSKLSNSREISFFEMVEKYPPKSSGCSFEDWMSRVTEDLGDILLCDITTRDVSEVGLSVVRAVVPGAQPLDIDHSRRALGHSRLRGEMEKRGVPLASIFNEPHPFP